jgi:hypothetical protein
MVGTLAAPWPLLPDSIKLKILSADHVYIQPSIDRCNHLIYILYILANKYHAVRVQIYADPQHASCRHIIRLDRPAACRHTYTPVFGTCFRSVPDAGSTYKHKQHAHEKYSLFRKIVVPSFFSLTKYTHDY